MKLNLNLDPTRRLERIRCLLMNNHPFYARVACSLGWHYREDLPFPTAATDGFNVYWHPQFVEDNSDDELIKTAVHEIHHVIKKHSWRRKERRPLLWNIACDYQINGEMDTMDFKGSLSKEWLIDHQYDNMLEEHIYDKLLQNPPPFYGGGGGYVLDGPDNISEGEADRRIDKLIEEAYKVAKDAGKVPGWLHDFVAKNREAQVNWKALLRNLIVPMFPRDTCWERPNRRLVHTGLYIPGVKLSGTAEIAVLVDTSGSVSADQISCFIGEINGIISGVTPSRIQLHWFEAEVWKTEFLGPGELLRIPDKIQSGGTNFEKAFAAVEGSPRIIVCLTDMYDSFDFQPPRGSRVIWVATTEVKAPWGQTVQIKV